MHIVLLGDSIFDNKSYVGDDPDVRTQLQEALPAGHRATLLAIDGSIIETVFAQIKRLPANASHLMISIGGNDLLGQMHTLNNPATSTAGALLEIAQVVSVFRLTYRSLLQSVCEHEIPTTLCTLYNPRFPGTDARQLTMTAISIFNDAIIQEAVLVGLPILEMRLICDEDTDFANPIEPSVKGGEKIVRAMLRVLHEHDFTRQQTTIYGR